MQRDRQIAFAKLPAEWSAMRTAWAVASAAERDAFRKQLAEAMKQTSASPAKGSRDMTPAQFRQLMQLEATRHSLSMDIIGKIGTQSCSWSSDCPGGSCINHVCR
jgi:hypothetical protein